jgi:hypothetical protein
LLCSLFCCVFFVFLCSLFCCFLFFLFYENFLFGINKRQGKPKGQSNMDNPETQIAFGTRYRTETKKIN